MTLKELQTKTDAELNEMAARVMGNGHIVPEAGYFDTTHQYPHYALWMNGVFYMRGPEDSWPWEPATDLNQAWELANREGWRGAVSEDRVSIVKPSPLRPIPLVLTVKKLGVDTLRDPKQAARALTLAAILSAEVKE